MTALLQVRVAVMVQAHPDRTEMAHTLAEQCGGMVVFDPDPDHPRRSPWRTYRHCIESAPGYAFGFTTAGSATHVLVLQDDTLPCRSFNEALPAAVSARPTDLLVFHVSGNPFEHKRALLDACSRDEPWAALRVGHRWVSAIATCWPAPMALDLLRYVDNAGWPSEFVADDEIIGRYASSEGVTPYATVPSLVEHTDMVPSLLGRKERYGNDPGRVAACFADNCAGYDATQVDWTLGTN